MPSVFVAATISSVRDQIMCSKEQNNYLSTEPWLQTPNLASYSHSVGFAAFLKENLQKLSFKADFTQSFQQENEILLKIKQLDIYNSLVSHLFTNEVNKEKDIDNSIFLDKFNTEIFPQTAKLPQILTANINNEVLQILTSASKDDTYTYDEEMESKSQSSELLYNKTEITVSEAQVGYILIKSLRKVVRETEQREIFFAQKCLLSLQNGVLTNIKFDRSNNSTCIVKFVAKFKNNNELNNRLRKEFSTQFLLSFFNNQTSAHKINEQIDFFENKETIASVSTFAGSTDILDFLLNTNTPDASNQSEFLNDFKDKIDILLQMAETVRTCHNTCVSHRDISLENFVLKRVDKEKPKEMGENFEVSLIDFGHCGILLKNNLTKFEGLLGKINYMSPELFELQKRYQNSKQKEDIFYKSEKSDIFSLGVCFFMILSKTQLFINQRSFAENSGELSELEVLNRIGNSFEEMKEKIIFESFEAKQQVELAINKIEEVIKKCLKYEENERSEVNELCEELKKVKESLRSL